MNISGYIFRAIIAIVVCVILVALLAAGLKAFAPTLFDAAQLGFLDLCIYALGVCYVIWGEAWFRRS